MSTRLLLSIEIAKDVLRERAHLLELALLQVIDTVHDLYYIQSGRLKWADQADHRYSLG